MSGSGDIVKTQIVLGKGATATVYKGYYRIDGKAVAIKKYKDGYKIQLGRELKALQKIEKHDNIVRILDQKDKDNHSYLVLEYCNGLSVDGYMKAELQYQSGLSVDKFHKALLDMTAGYRYLHDINLAHRDIKPDNIMMMFNIDGTITYKIGDLGSSKEVPDETVTDPEKRLCTIIGKEEFMDPFILDRYINRSNKRNIEPYKKNVDLWSIGCTLVCIATNGLAFSCENNVKNKENMILQMQQSRKYNDICSRVVNKTEVEHSEDFRVTSLVNITASENLQKIYKDIICYCFSDGKTRDTKVYFEKVEAVRKQKLCYFLDLNQAYGYYDMQDSPIADNSQKFSVRSVDQVGEKLDIGAPVVFLALFQEKCTPHWPNTKQLVAVRRDVNHDIDKLEEIQSACKSFYSGYNNFNKVMQDLRIFDQLALLTVEKEVYSQFEAYVTETHTSNQNMTGVCTEIVHIWEEMTEDKVKILEPVLTAFASVCRNGNRKIKADVVKIVTRVYGDKDRTVGGGFIGGLCDAILEGLQRAESNEIQDSKQLGFMLKLIR